MTPHALLFIIAAIGISETAYLIKTRVRSETPICPIGEQCAVVLASRYSRLFLLSNDVWGLLFYITSALLTLFLAIGIAPVTLWYTLLKISVLIGSLFSLFLIYLQWRIIRAWCFWCVMSAITVWLMGALLMTSNLVR
ncbi:MAG: vitamin K epoxide reductase family protein [Patescibacteria group bacterium]